MQINTYRKVVETTTLYTLTVDAEELSRLCDAVYRSIGDTVDEARIDYNELYDTIAEALNEDVCEG